MNRALNGAVRESLNTSQGPLRRSALEELGRLAKDGSPHLVCRVISLYLSHSLQNIRAMHEAVACGNHAKAGQAAHSLISSSGMVGAMTLSALCTEMENRCRTRAGDGVQDLCRRIQDEHGAVSEALAAELRRLSS